MPELTAEEVYERYIVPMTPSERQRRAEILGSAGGPARQGDAYEWAGLRGSLPYPAAGEDAQAWVSRARRESDPRRGIMDLCGLGKGIWEGIDPELYVTGLRDEWDEDR